MSENSQLMKWSMMPIVALCFMGAAIGVAHELKGSDSSSSSSGDAGDAGARDCDCHCFREAIVPPALPQTPEELAAISIKAALNACRQSCMDTMNRKVDALDVLYGAKVSNERTKALQPIFADEDKCWAACGDGGVPPTPPNALNVSTQIPPELEIRACREHCEFVMSRQWEKAAENHGAADAGFKNVLAEQSRCWNACDVDGGKP